MTNHQWWLECGGSPVVPLVDVEICAADGGQLNPDTHIGGADLGLGNVGQNQAGYGIRLDQSLHDPPPTTPSSDPTVTKASTARSMSVSSCAAFIWVRIRAVPMGTTGYEKAVT